MEEWPPVTDSAVLAVVSAFAADNMLRNMIDRVLKRMEQKTEKTKDTEKT
jgi:hypothetical protein